MREFAVTPLDLSHEVAAYVFSEVWGNRLREFFAVHPVYSHRGAVVFDCRIEAELFAHPCWRSVAHDRHDRIRVMAAWYQRHSIPRRFKPPLAPQVHSELAAAEFEVGTHRSTRHVFDYPRLAGLLERASSRREQVGIHLSGVALSLCGH